jgi:hypothetical protein
LKNDRVLTKAFCKRTHFYTPYDVNISDEIKWIKGVVYDIGIIYLDVSHQIIDCYYINNSLCNQNLFYPFSKKEFDKYFIHISEYRNSKIEKILNDK